MEVKLSDGLIVGDGHPCAVVAEIGINHNGERSLLTSMCSTYARLGASAIKLQTRVLDEVYTPEELERHRDHPWANCTEEETNGRQKAQLELTGADYVAAKRAALHLCHVVTSPWSAGSVDKAEALLDPPWYKIASASITDHALLRRVRDTKKPVVMSTGMSSLSDVEDALEALEDVDGKLPPLCLLVCTSTYPTDDEDLHLRRIERARSYWGVPVGLSCHSLRPEAVVSAVALGADLVEVHVTLSRHLYGSDQHASWEPSEFASLLDSVRRVERMLGNPELRAVAAEEPIRKKLRRIS